MIIDTVQIFREFYGERGKSAPHQPPHPSPLPQILRGKIERVETLFREVFGGEGAEARNFKTYVSGYERFRLRRELLAISY